MFSYFNLKRPSDFGRGVQDDSSGASSPVTTAAAGQAARNSPANLTTSNLTTNGYLAMTTATQPAAAGQYGQHVVANNRGMSSGPSGAAAAGRTGGTNYSGKSSITGNGAVSMNGDFDLNTLASHDTMAGHQQPRGKSNIICNTGRPVILSPITCCYFHKPTGQGIWAGQFEVEFESKIDSPGISRGTFPGIRLLNSDCNFTLKTIPQEYPGKSI